MRSRSDAYAYECGTGAVGRNWQSEQREWRAMVQLITHEELQNSCSAILGPAAYSVPDGETMATLITPKTMVQLIAPAVQARAPVLRFHPADVKGRAMARAQVKVTGMPKTTEQQLYGIMLGSADDGLPDVPGMGPEEQGPTVPNPLPGQSTDGGPLPGYYFKPDASGGSYVKTGAGWPPAAAYRPGNWDFAVSRYALAFGDTLSGLAITYLGSPQRWKEIWDANPQDWRFSHSPDKLMAGTWIMMPFEARDRAKAMLANPTTPPAPSTVGKKAPIPVQGEDPNAPVVAGGAAAATGSKAKKYLPWILGGAAVLGVGYYATR